jgi:Arc/MetJ-type ribon-helix-helix transcriptional regulator
MNSANENFTVRLPVELRAVVKQVVKDRGYKNPSAFFREAVRNQVARDQGREERFVVHCDRMEKTQRQIHNGISAIFAVLVESQNVDLNSPELAELTEKFIGARKETFELVHEPNPEPDQPSPVEDSGASGAVPEDAIYFG